MPRPPATDRVRPVSYGVGRGHRCPCREEELRVVTSSSIGLTLEGDMGCGLADMCPLLAAAVLRRGAVLVEVCGISREALRRRMSTETMGSGSHTGP